MKLPISRQAGVDYPAYGGNKANNRYSPLTQINMDNVKDLQVAWTYFANDKPDSTQNGTRPERNTMSADRSGWSSVWHFRRS